MEHKTYVLDFFGSRVLRGTGFRIPPSRFLTAYDTNSYNTFLGYYMDDRAFTAGNTSSSKKLQGIIWGKDTKHFEGKFDVLRSMASKVHLLSTATRKVFEHHNIHWLGHQSKKKWYTLLRESRFLLGLGEPLLGPSALDAVAAGCMYLNPIYLNPLKHNDQDFGSQHPYALKNIGEPYVCSYKEDDMVSLQGCIDKSLRTDLEPHIPLEFTKEAYRQRVIKIFNL
jgi:Glycosyltransferase family 18